MRLHLRQRRSRVAAVMAGLLLAVTSGLTLAPAASAAASIGSLTFTPATGTATSAITVQTVSSGSPAGCPSPATNVRGVINGPGGWNNITVISKTSQGISNSSDFQEGFSDTMSGIAQSNSLTITPGTYNVSLICQNSLGTSVYGTFDAPLYFTSATAYQTTNPNAVATTTTVTASPSSPQNAGTSVTFTATMTPSNAAGTVQFKDGGTNLGSPQTVSAGKATLTTSSLSATSHSISAVFTPTDTNAFGGSTSAPITYLINTPAQTTTTTVTASPPSPQLSGTAVTFTATLTPSGAAGTVQFKDGGTNLGSPQTVSAGKATLTTSTLSATSHSISAVFTPTNASAFTASTSPSITYVVNAPAQTTTTTVTASPPSPQVSGTSVTFTATLTPSGAAGTVQFKDGNAALGSPQTVSAGKATLTTSTLSATSHSISAVFTPADASAFTASTSQAITYVISAPAATATSTSLTANPASPVVAGTSVTFTATVTPSAAGTVQFKDGGNNLGSPQTVSGGNATLVTSSLAATTHSITAVFVPTDSSAFTGSTSPALSYVVSPAPAQNTTTTVTASPASPQLAGAPITFTATVSPSAAGSVQFKDGNASLGSPVTVSNGQAMLQTSSLGVGPHTITAVFTPADASAFNGSTSQGFPYTINPAPAQNTSTAVSANPPSPTTAGTSVTFTATVTPTAAGSIQFKDGGSPLGGSQTLSGGHASLTTSSLSTTTHSITAVFTPADSSAFNASTSPALTYVVNPAAVTTTTSLTSNPASPQASGTAVTFTATVSPAAAGTVQFKDGSDALGVPQAVTGGHAMYATSSLGSGPHSITAVFTPTDANAFTTSTSQALSYTITGGGGGPSALGTLTFTPAIGDDTSAMTLTTHSTGTPAGCPAGATNVKALVNGPAGWSNITVLSNTPTGVSNTADFSIPLSDTFAGIAQSNSLSIVAGRYDITLDCQNRLGTSILGTFTGPIWFTDATHYQSTDPANTVTTTTTSLVANPADRQDLGKPVTLTATVTPAGAIGAVQFTDTVQGTTTNLGAAVPLSGGHATYVTSSLAFGLHTFAAKFLPTDAKQFTTSTSDNVVYVVALPAPPKLVVPAHLLGDGHYRTVLTCASTFQGATSYAYTWYRNGKVVPGADRNTYFIGTADRFRLIACRVVASNAGGTTPSTSKPVFAGLSTFKLRYPPFILGHHQVGHYLVGIPGFWEPGPAFYQWVWLRDGHPIKGANIIFYRVTKADMGHQISVRITVMRLFFYPAVAVSRPV